MSGQKIIDGLKDAIAGNFASVHIDGKTWVPKEWQPIATAPGDGRTALVFRPLARSSGDEPVALKRLIGGNHHCWDTTVPEGAQPTNPTDGACHVTHWMPLPDPPTESALNGGESK